MRTRVEPAASADHGRGALRLTRGIAAAWWYTASAVMFFELMLIGAWTVVAGGQDSAMRATVVAVGGVLWCASTVPLLRDHRSLVDAPPVAGWARVMVPMAVAAAYGVAAGSITGVWQLAAMPLAQCMVLLHWPRGVRRRVVVATTVALACLALVDSSGAPLGDAVDWLPVVYPILLPAMTASSLWWWDVLIELDRARASEARLAATQERLRVATDVHDLQGHHLQVIALQLELAERLLPHDPAEGVAQLRAARTSVDEARQGTRDLATRFRSVPLGDEVANARDLLAAAGLEVAATIAADAHDAPTSVLGPVIRETTTNVLRHGDGRRARLALERLDGAWRYTIANDAVADASPGEEGSGLDGMRRRVEEAHGTLELQRGGDEFVAVVTVPARDGERR